MASSEKKAKMSNKKGDESAGIKKTTLLLCAVGLILSIYSVYVEVLIERVPGYQALCDISPTMSCSRVFSSKWGKGFGLVEKVFSKDSIINQPNGVYGMAAYTFTVVMAYQPEFPASLVQTCVAFIMNCGSVYLGYILFYILKDVCVICMSIYVVNFFLLIVSVMKAKNSYHKEMKKLA